MKQVGETKVHLSEHDEKFKEIDKKLIELSDNKEVDTVKEDMSKISDELKTLKISMGEILSRLNDNRTEIDEILNNLKERKDNFNLASNMASLSPAVRTSKRGGEDSAQIEQMQEDLEDLKHYVDSKLMEIDIKLDMLSSGNTNVANFTKNIQEETKKSPGERTTTKLKTFVANKIEYSSGNVVGMPQLMKKIDEVDKNQRALDRSFKRLLTTFNVNDVLDDIAKLKDSKADKADIPDADSFNYLLDDIKVKIKKFDLDIKEINQKIDSILAKMVNQDNMGDQGFNGINLDREILQAYLTKDDFDNYMKSRDEDINKLKKEMQKAKDYIAQMMASLKKKVDTVDLTNTKGVLNEKIEELARACNLKFADKNECLKNFKHIEDQLKKILFILQKKSEQNSEGDGNWLLAKKPINGYSCAACESYIGELNNNIKKYVPWNRLPMKDNGDSLYRIGNGYSKMLQMINFDNNGNVNISPDNSDDIHTIVSNDSNVMNSFNIHALNNVNNNGNNIMGKTFYPKAKNSQSKTPGKFRVQSAYDGSGDRSSLKNSNNLEENKNNYIIGNTAKTGNQKGLPKINFMLDESNNQKDPKITKIMKKSQSKTSLKISGKKI